MRNPKGVTTHKVDPADRGLPAVTGSPSLDRAIRSNPSPTMKAALTDYLDPPGTVYGPNLRGNYNGYHGDS